MNILFLRGFNNYFNRIVKKYSTLQDYRTHSNTYLDLSSINFNPNDGVVTELIIGGPTQIENNKPLDWENIGSPDYAVCYETGANNTTTIISRWYVLESVRTRTGQYKIALKRDSIVDHLNSVINARIFVEKGMISDPNDPLIFNKESMSYNQVKVSEKLLQDPTKSAWLVGYIDKTKPSSSTSVSTVVSEEYINYIDSDDLPFEFNPSGNSVISRPAEDTWIGLRLLTSCRFFFEWDPVDHKNTYDTCLVGVTYDKTEFKNWQIKSDTARNPRNVSYVSNYNYNRSGYYQNLNTDTNNMSFSPMYIYIDDYAYPIVYIPNNNFGISYSPYRADWEVQGTAGLVDILNNASPSASFDSTQKALLDNMYDYIHDLYYALPAASDLGSTLNGKIVKYNDKYYVMTVTSRPYYIFYKDSNFPGSIINGPSNLPQGRLVSINQANTSLSDPFNAAFGSTSQTGRTYAENTTNAKYNGIKYSSLAYNIVSETYISYQEVSVVSANASIPTNANRNFTYNAVFDMFAIPFGNINFKTSSSGPTYTTIKNVGLGIARAIMTSLGDGAVYDLQILPYCPSGDVRGIYEDINELDLSLLNSKEYTLISTQAQGSSSSTPGSFILWISSCTGSFNISSSINIWNGTSFSDSLKKKISNETLLCRLVSPNFSGQFEFSLAKNNGVSLFNVDYTYQPYTPYIHINPDFKGIYGADWNDARGLICGGDFSIQFNVDAWATYQLNNKNYQQIFDRQVQNIDVNNSIAMEQQVLSAKLGTVQGGLSGLIGGASAGASAGPLGALAGALVGGVAGAVTSNIAGQKDTEFLARSQSENRQYAIDLYGYQLGNIQALPYSIRGTNALTNNNKLWPLVEVYSATEKEINILSEKIKYDGMTIMAIGKITDYCTSYDFDKTYFKGKLIRIEDINDDMHIADDIYNELNKGIYIPEGGLS